MWLVYKFSMSDMSVSIPFRQSLVFGVFSSKISLNNKVFSTEGMAIQFQGPDYHSSKQSSTDAGKSF